MLDLEYPSFEAFYKACCEAHRATNDPMYNAYVLIAKGDYVKLPDGRIIAREYV